MSKRSFLSSSDPQCQWDPAAQSCAYHEPARSLMTAVYVAIISTVLSVPLVIFCEHLCFAIFCAASATAPSTRAGTVAVMPTGHDDAELGRAAEVVSGAGGQEPDERVVVRSAADDCAQLAGEMRRARDYLPPDEQANFDRTYLLKFSAVVPSPLTN